MTRCFDISDHQIRWFRTLELLLFDGFPYQHLIPIVHVDFLFQKNTFSNFEFILMQNSQYAYVDQIRLQANSKFKKVFFWNRLMLI